MDEKQSGALHVGDPVLITTYGTEDAPPAKYMGVLTGMGDVFLGARVSHEEKMMDPEISKERRTQMVELLKQRPMWLLHLQVGLKYRMITKGLGRDELAEQLADWILNMLVVEAGPRPTVVEYPVPKHMWLSLSSVERMESMVDLADTAVLLDLDFEPAPVEEDPKPSED